ncbi:hypothetical protein [Streptomyces sp. Wb2n-11]|uniref:hypothetical protein n=1 Tax=Streptomyces sp. Wb2n-11 TaxID=1030533 RepID=UPI000A5AAC7B|nr:hypothetical protein [Streptomyces sp. Wb2n-11]
MNVRLTDPQQPHAPQAGQPTLNDNARAFLTEIEQALAEAQRPAPTVPTSYKDFTPVPPIGTAPPVPQPGRAAMSAKAVDDCARMIGASVVIAVTGGAGTSIMWASGHADPEVIAWVCAAPVGLAAPILAVSWLIKRVKDVAEAAPAEHHHHYDGNVYQDHRTTHTETRGIWAKTNNQLPR